VRRRIFDFQFSIYDFVRDLRDVVLQLQIVGTLLVSALVSMRAQETPTITISKGDKINLTVSSLGGSEGAAATKILQNDLTLSGYVHRALAWRSVGTPVCHVERSRDISHS
jgi:hypothetical protein